MAARTPAKRRKGNRPQGKVKMYGLRLPEALVDEFDLYSENRTADLEALMAKFIKYKKSKP